MEELKYSVDQNNFTGNILDICSAKYDPSDGLSNFYDRLKFIVCNNLKRKGFIDGSEVLLEDEILSPTFEEVIILWCLDKVSPNLSTNVRSAFNHQLNDGISIKELKDDIFQYFSNKDNIDESPDNLKAEKTKSSNKSEKVVAKEDPEEKSAVEDPFLKPGLVHL